MPPSKGKCNLTRQSRSISITHVLYVLKHHQNGFFRETVVMLLCDTGYGREGNEKTWGSTQANKTTDTVTSSILWSTGKTSHAVLHGLIDKVF